MSLSNVFNFNDSEKLNNSILFFHKNDSYLCEEIYNYYNESGNSSNVSYCYDVTDKKESQWYAIVIRNIPRAISDCELEQILNEKCINGKILYTIPSENIGLSRCSIAVVDNLELAERLCVELNKKQVNKMNLKVLIYNIGPSSSQMLQDKTRTQSLLFRS